MTEQPSSPGQRYRADIQGLRALAIVPVVIYHAMPGWAPGGFVGVDVFFVISGFLITRILMRELETGNFSIARFYERRVRRLFPALYLVLALTLLGGYALLPPDALTDLGKSTGATAAFVSNLYFWKTSGYFDAASELKPLLHTWSLAVEEQFYLLFPIFLFLIYRYLRRHLGIALWACAILSLGIAVWQAGARPLDGFYLPLGRAYELLIGAIVVAAPPPRIRNDRLADALSIAAIAMIVASIATFHADMRFPGAAALLPCIGSALLLHLGADRDVPPLGGRLLSNPLFVFFGAISYSLYLWHWPVLVYARYAALGEPGPLLVAGAVAFATLAAWLSWRFVEQPFLHGRNQRRAFLAGGAAMGITFAAAALLVVTHGLPGRFDAEAQAKLAAASDYNPRRAECHASGTPIAYADNCLFGAPGAQPDTALWGDSLGAEIAVALGEQAAARGGSVMQITTSSCPPTPGFAPGDVAICRNRNRETLAALSRDPRIRTVVLVSAYADYPERERPQLLAGYEEAATALRTAGKQLVLVYPIPKQPFPAPLALGLMSRRGMAAGDFGIAAHDFQSVNRSFVALLDRLTPKLAAQRIVPAERLCDATRCRAWRDGVGTLYFDDLHLSLTGARYVFGPPLQ
jgi:peptidoglycan/LPS O-acetylase OafA/YrhL